MNDRLQGEALAALAQHLQQHSLALAPGWRVQQCTRASGASAGQTDLYYLSPCGRRLRSRAEVVRFLGADAPPPKRRRDASPPPPAAASPAPAASPLTTSPYFAAVNEPTTVVAARRRQPQPPPFSGTVRRAADCAWIPPPSPYGLLQECLYADPWKVLVACVMLNKTTGTQVRLVVRRLFDLLPSAEAGAACAVEDIRRVIMPLGLVKRAEGIVQLSRAYLRAEWTRVTELPGVGRYGSDAYALFCTGEWQNLPPPPDKELIRYWQFLHDTGGQGRGYERETL